MIIVANWKMNCLTNEARALINSIKAGYSGKSEVVICPPFTLLSMVSDMINGTKLQLGAQNCSLEEKGAFTGEISASQLKDIGTKYVIVGHSERRRYHNETNELIKKKAERAIKSGLIPIICIGETEAERKSGKIENTIINQMESCIPNDKPERFIVAYEPVWAIGTGITATSVEIEPVHKLISSKLKNSKIIYGGSVNERNCKEICSISSVSGLLVGGVSLNAQEFINIINV